MKERPLNSSASRPLPANGSGPIATIEDVHRAVDDLLATKLGGRFCGKLGIEVTVKYGSIVYVDSHEHKQLRMGEYLTK